MQNSLAIQEAGDKKAPCIVFLHGAFFDSSMWTSHIEALSIDYRCIAVDLSARTSEGAFRPFTVETLVEGLEAAIKSSKAKKPALCGHGLGGYVALRALDRKPDGYSALMLCDAHPGAPSNPEVLYWSMLLDQLYGEDGGAALQQVFTDLFAESSREEDGSPFESLLEKAMERERDLVAGQIVATMSRIDTTEAVEGAAIPKLLLTGQFDRFASPDDLIDLGLRVSGAQFVRVPDTAHAAVVEHPTLVLKAFNRFLNSVHASEKV